MAKSNKATVTATDDTIISTVFQTCEVNIQPGSELIEGFVGATFTAFQYTPKAFKAVVDGTEFSHDKSLDGLVKAIAINLNKAMMIKGKDYATDKPVWIKVSNEVEKEPLTPEQEKTLADTLVRIKTLDGDTDSTKKAARDNTISLGLALATIKDILSPISNADWGKYQREHLPHRFQGKNATSEHINIARIPATILEACPTDKASARAINNWYDAGISVLATNAANKVVGNADLLTDVIAHACKEATDLDAASELVFALDATDTIKAMLVRLVEFGKEKAAIAYGVDANGIYDAAQEEMRVDHVNNGIFANEVNVAALIAHKDYRKTIKLEVAKMRTSPVKEAKKAADNAADKYSDTKQDVAIGFAAYTPVEAAKHLATILSVRDDTDLVLGMMKDALQEIATAKADKIAADELAAEEADQKEAA